LLLPGLLLVVSADTGFRSGPEGLAVQGPGPCNPDARRGGEAKWPKGKWPNGKGVGVGRGGSGVLGLRGEGVRGKGWGVPRMREVRCGKRREKNTAAPDRSGAA